MLREAHVTAQSLSEAELGSFLRAMLTITDLGMLITDLEHRALACNTKFGELFQVDSILVPSMGVEELRGYVYPRLADTGAWRSHLDTTYADPTQRLEDELILERPFLALRRITGPVTNADGEIIGRIWTFQDVSASVMRQRRRDVIVEASTYHDPDPAKVCRYIVDRVAEVYDSTTILSIWEGEWMRFREVARPPVEMTGVTQNAVKDAYCRVALQDIRPVVVQDARTFDEFRDILPAQFGFCRCLSVPICNMMNQPIGTLCFMDRRTDEPITGDDVEFLSVLANRLSAELERERLYEERTAQQRFTLEQQDRDLRTTEEVLDAINEAFNYLGTDLPEERLWSRQVEILRGLLGYKTVALLEVNDESMRGCVAGSNHPEPRPIEVPATIALRTMTDRPEGEPIQWNVGESPLGDAIGSRQAVITRLSVPGPAVLLLFGHDDPSQLAEVHHTLHLTAIVEQVSLLLSAQRLRSDLLSTNEELRMAQSRLIQAEKLSVTGTLAASVAHDIRNIMASLSLVISQPRVSDEEKLAQVRTQVDRFTLLSHRLLSYVRPRSLSREQVFLATVVNQAATLLGPQAYISGVQIATNVNADVEVMADSNRVEHLLVNLMMNAMQAMKSSGGILSLRSRNEDEEIVLEIEDNGRGIPEHLIDRIFEPFVSSRPDGFGLGLYSCKQIANEHGWNISVKSDLGKGTLFKIGIPIGGKLNGL